MGGTAIYYEFSTEPCGTPDRYPVGHLIGWDLVGGTAIYYLVI